MRPFPAASEADLMPLKTSSASVVGEMLWGARKVAAACAQDAVASDVTTAAAPIVSRVRALICDGANIFRCMSALHWQFE